MLPPPAVKASDKWWVENILLVGTEKAQDDTQDD